MELFNRMFMDGPSYSNSDSDEGVGVTTHCMLKCSARIWHLPTTNSNLHCFTPAADSIATGAKLVNFQLPDTSWQRHDLWTHVAKSTLIVSISACYYSELCNAITSYLGGVQLLLTKVWKGCSDIVEHKWLCLVNYYILIV